MELIKLQCTQCNAPLEVEPSTVIKDNDVFVVRRGQVICCSHCGAEYVVGEELPQVQVVEQLTAFDQRGQQVGAQVNICGDGNVIGNGNITSVGVIGNGAKITGGIHFGSAPKKTKSGNVSIINGVVYIDGKRVG